MATETPPSNHELPTLTIPRLLWRGFFRRCPQCGSGSCFETWFKMKERCPRCQFPLQREEGYWIGGIGMNTVVTFGLLLITFVVIFALTWNDRSGLVVFVPGFAVALIVPIAFFGSSQTLWSAIHLALTPVQPEDGIDLRWWSPHKKHS